MGTHRVFACAGGIYVLPEVYADEQLRDNLTRQTIDNLVNRVVHEGYQVVPDSDTSVLHQRFICPAHTPPDQDHTQPLPYGAPVPEGYDEWWGIVVHVKAYDPKEN